MVASHKNDSNITSVMRIYCKCICCEKRRYPACVCFCRGHRLIPAKCQTILLRPAQKLAVFVGTFPSLCSISPLYLQTLDLIEMASSGWPVIKTTPCLLNQVLASRSRSVASCTILSKQSSVRPYLRKRNVENVLLL